MDELKIGDTIKDRYTLMQFLGNGSFGEVWLAHDQLSGRDVALKIYLTLDPAGVEEFQREYANTIDLSSPFLLTPEYFDVYGRRPFLVMKYCENGSSSKLVGNVTENQLWQFIQDVANGLAVLHNQSDPIVHQDIKPDNILIDGNGRFLITDFGISKRLRATMRRQSKRDVSSGAMPYMAPERFDSNPRLNTSSDIWSLGASIYELATGELPFSGFGGAMQRNGAEVPKLPSLYSERINIIMQRCLALDENERPSISELLKMMTCGGQDLKECEKIINIQLDDPVATNMLNIRGNITEIRIKPKFNNAFGWVWFCVVMSTPFFYDLFNLYWNETEMPLRQILREISLISPVVMWIIGYSLVKWWEPIGKYLMCGAIYLIILLLIYGLYGMISLEITHPSIIPSLLNQPHWYDYIDPVIAYLLLAWLFIHSFYGLCCAVRIIKKGSTDNPGVWSYSGSRIIPITMEFIIPLIVLILYIISWNI